MATTGIPPLPMGGAAPTPAPVTPAGMGDLLAAPPAPTPAPDVQERAKAVMRQIRDLMMTVEALARQFPPASAPLQQALQGLQDSVVAIVNDLNRTQEASPTPRAVA